MWSSSKTSSTSCADACLWADDVCLVDFGKARVWSSEPIVVLGEVTSLGRDEIADANLQRVSFSCL